MAWLPQEDSALQKRSRLQGLLGFFAPRQVKFRVWVWDASGQWFDVGDGRKEGRCATRSIFDIQSEIINVSTLSEPPTPHCIYKHPDNHYTRLQVKGKKLFFFRRYHLIRQT